MINRNSINLV